MTSEELVEKAALRWIVNNEHATQAMALAHVMAQVARTALEPRKEGGE